MNNEGKDIKAGAIYKNPAADNIPVIAQFPWILRENNAWQPPTFLDFEWLAEGSVSFAGNTNFVQIRLPS